ncbi:MAG: SoxR reducing system RseC family protein [Bacteroidales bacterium]
MRQDEEIVHEGVIVSSSPGFVNVMISQNVSCIGCQASNICNLNNSNNKTLKINGNFNFLAGTRVLVSVSRSQGYLALFLGYIMPLIVLITSLLVLLSFSAGELIAGLISLGITALYFLILFFYRKTVSKKFSFILKKL